jgi:hypothetical protein
MGGPFGSSFVLANQLRRFSEHAEISKDLHSNVVRQRHRMLSYNVSHTIVIAGGMVPFARQAAS